MYSVGHHDVESRQKALPDILSKIQIHQCTHEFIYYILNTYETLLEGHKIQNLLLCNIVKSLRKDKDFYLRQEKSCGNFDLSIALLGGLTRYDYARKCLLFHNNSWKHLTDIPGDASSLAVSTCSDGILVCGGSIGGKPTDICYMYIMKAQVWTKICRMSLHGSMLKCPMPSKYLSMQKILKWSIYKIILK